MILFEYSRRTDGIGPEGLFETKNVVARGWFASHLSRNITRSEANAWTADFLVKANALRYSWWTQKSRTKIAELNTEEQTDGNWSSFQLAKSTPPQSVIDYAIAPSARMA